MPFSHSVDNHIIYCGFRLCAITKSNVLYLCVTIWKCIHVYRTKLNYNCALIRKDLVLNSKIIIIQLNKILFVICSLAVYCIWVAQIKIRACTHMLEHKKLNNKIKSWYAFNVDVCVCDCVCNQVILCFYTYENWK